MLFSQGENEFYQGRVFGETNSHVNAHIEDGLLTTFILPKENSCDIEVKYSFIIFVFNKMFACIALLETPARIKPRIHDSVERF